MINNAKASVPFILRTVQAMRASESDALPNRRYLPYPEYT